MPNETSRLLVTGATGELGRLVIDELLTRVPAGRVVAAVRDPAKAADMAARGVDVRPADYADPTTLDAAFAGVDRVLLISSNNLAGRVAEHRNVIDAARRAGVKRIAYTSVLRADTSPLGLAEDHRQTEASVRASGVPFVLLRNNWYTENYTAGVGPAIAHGAVLGCAGYGRISSASRADYAAAAAVVLVEDGHAGRTYELAGDAAYTLTEYAATVAAASGKPVVYKDVSEAAYRAALVSAGLPAEMAELIADGDAGAAGGAMFDDSRQLSRLIGRPTTPMAATVDAAVAGM